MELTNMQMEQMVESLMKYLDRRDIIGYAAARNVRILSNELTEYMAFKSDLFKKYGEKELDDDGNPTGNMFISLESENLKDYMSQIEDIAKAKSNPDIFKIDYGQALDVLSGKEILEIDWMFEE